MKVKKAYKKKYNLALSLSNPEKSYNKTDVIYPNEPYGMLLFSGTDKKKIGFVLFETKGITTQSFFVYYQMRNKRIIKIDTLILNGRPSTLLGLKQLIATNSYI